VGEYPFFGGIGPLWELRSFIYKLDAKAAKGKRFPNWRMAAVSTFGLGFNF